MARARTRPVHRLADLLVFAPVEFLLQAPHLIPELAEAGRRRLRGCPVAGGRAAAGPDPARATMTAARPSPPEGVEADQEIVIAVEHDDAHPPDLPIPGYDQLAASQVIARLPGLSSAELAQIEEHEQSHRRRRTVLAKIAQLRPA